MLAGLETIAPVEVASMVALVMAFAIKVHAIVTRSGLEWIAPSMQCAQLQPIMQNAVAMARVQKADVCVMVDGSGMTVTLSSAPRIAAITVLATMGLVTVRRVTWVKHVTVNHASMAAVPMDAATVHLACADAMLGFLVLLVRGLRWIVHHVPMATVKEDNVYARLVSQAFSVTKQRRISVLMEFLRRAVAFAALAGMDLFATANWRHVQQTAMPMGVA